MSSNERVLIVDDEADASESLARALSARGLGAELRCAQNSEQAQELAVEWDPQVAIIDLNLNPTLGVSSGFALLAKIVSQNSNCRVIVLTGNAALENGVHALNSGAASFLEKPADIEHLMALIKDNIKLSNLRREFSVLKRASERDLASQTIIGESPQMRAVQESVRYAASSNQALLITGETGTGKGLCAQVVHQLSSRRSANFVRYQPNFSSVDLVNSDLFGHRKGSFTGSQGDRQGLMAAADKGSLFLDEVEELPKEVQVALLGVLQERAFRSLGSDQEQHVDFRLICATNADLEAALNSGRLRKDFYHRIAHLEIHLPPLRERLADIPLLARHVLAALNEREEVATCSISAAALDRLQQYNWPGNVRELQAVVEGAAQRAQYSQRIEIQAEDILIKRQFANHPVNFADRVAQFKIDLINEALQRNGGNQVKAAQEIGLDRSTLRRILERK